MSLIHSGPGPFTRDASFRPSYDEIGNEDVHGPFELAPVQGLLWRQATAPWKRCGELVLINLDGKNDPPIRLPSSVALSASALTVIGIGGPVKHR